LIGAGAGATWDIPTFGLMMKNLPHSTAWMSCLGDELGVGLVCHRTGERYVVAPGRLEIVA
jgi:hypothetical protein